MVTSFHTEKEWKGKRIKITGNHPHSGEFGKVEGFEKTLVGWGMKIRLDNGEVCFVFNSNDLKEV